MRRAESAQDGPAAGKPAVLAAEEKVETGEEGERTVFAGDGTLFSFDTAGWRERGRGELRVKVDRSGAPFLTHVGDPLPSGCSFPRGGRVLERACSMTDDRQLIHNERTPPRHLGFADQGLSWGTACVPLGCGTQLVRWACSLCDTGQARLVMRQRGNLRLLLNANLWDDMAVNVMDGGVGVTFAVQNAVAAPAAVTKDGGTQDGSTAAGLS